MNPPIMDSFVVRGARVMTADGGARCEDLTVAGTRIAPPVDAPDAPAIECAGASIVPLFVESAVAQLPEAERDRFELVPGNAATFAVIRRRVVATQIRSMLIVDPGDLAAVWVDGHLEAWDGEPTRPPGRDLADPTTAERWIGTWVHRSRGLEQHLLADGHYTETRGGRRDAYTGRYWVHEDRITYLDDSGFWAFGQLVDDVLHHAGFVMRRR